MGFLPAFGPCGLGLHPGLTSKARLLQWARLFFGFGEWVCEPIFQTLSVAPIPCVRCAWARAVTFLVSDAISMCLLETGLVEA